MDGAFPRRWQAIDPLLPERSFASPHCGAELVVTGPDGQTVAAGRCEHWSGAAGSLDLSWGAARRFQLTALVADPDVAPALDRLLSLWHDHLAEVPGTEAEDTAAIVTWPSRDIGGITTLLRHGFAPLEVIAARRAPGKPAAVPHADAGDGTRIRSAVPADIDAIVRLGLELIRYDAHFCAVSERADSAAALRGEAAALVADGWTWLAERDGAAIGILSAQRPEAAGWIAPMASAAPAAYLMLMFVQSGERGAGVGTALTDRYHRAADEAGVAVTLLHHAQLNPLSAPFWNRRGYRPLWTSWQGLPARAIGQLRINPPGRDRSPAASGRTAS